MRCMICNKLCEEDICSECASIIKETNESWYEEDIEEMSDDKKNR